MASSLGSNLSFHCLGPRMMISAPAAWCSHPNAKAFDGATKQLTTHLAMYVRLNSWVHSKAICICRFGVFLRFCVCHLCLENVGLV